MGSSRIMPACPHRPSGWFPSPSHANATHLWSAGLAPATNPKAAAPGAAVPTTCRPLPPGVDADGSGSLSWPPPFSLPLAVSTYKYTAGCSLGAEARQAGSASSILGEVAIKPHLSPSPSEPLHDQGVSLSLLLAVRSS
jgi:hypothetical protein